MSSKTIYFPGLNGLRAIAALAVVVSHITRELGSFYLDPYIFSDQKNGPVHGLPLAGYGVSIFFVLSGFLITYLLQAEKEKQEIDIKKFYIRRILRIWPLYYMYMFVAVLALLYFNLDISFKSLLFYIFYAANVPIILNISLPLLHHYWSLGVEEQFYLFWPWFNKLIRSLFIPVLMLIIVLIGLKLFLHFFYPNSIMETVIHVTRFHCMMIGALGAILYKTRNPLFLKLADNKIIQLACWSIMFLIAINKFHLASVIDTEVVSVVALCLIIGQIGIKNRIINLEVNVMDFLGKISYGIYVIHPLIILLFSKLLGQLSMKTPIKYILIYTIITGATILFSYLSYTYIESYFLRFKRRFEVVKSSSTRNADTSEPIDVGTSPGKMAKSVK